MTLLFCTAWFGIGFYLALRHWRLQRNTEQYFRYEYNSNSADSLRTLSVFICIALIVAGPFGLFMLATEALNSDQMPPEEYRVRSLNPFSETPAIPQESGYGAYYDRLKAKLMLGHWSKYE